MTLHGGADQALNASAVMEIWRQFAVIEYAIDESADHEVFGAEHIAVGVVYGVAAGIAPDMLGNGHVYWHAFASARSLDSLYLVPVGEAVERSIGAVKIHMMRLTEGCSLVTEGGAVNHADGAAGKFHGEHATVVHLFVGIALRVGRGTRRHVGQSAADGFDLAEKPLRQVHEMRSQIANNAGAGDFAIEAPDIIAFAGVAAVITHIEVIGRILDNRRRSVP